MTTQTNLLYTDLINANKRISQLETQVQKLQNELSKYEKIYGNQLDSLFDDIDGEEKQNNVEKTTVDWNLIHHKVFDTHNIEENEQFIINMLKNEEITVHDEDSSGRTLLHYAAGEGRSNLVTVCVNLGADIKKKSKPWGDALTMARAGRHFGVSEYLLLQSIGGCKAEAIINQSNNIWNENALLDTFMNKIKDEKYNSLKKQIVNIVNDILSDRDPVSSFLVNFCMTLEPVTTWKNIKQTIQNIVDNTEDKIGWYYLNNYLVKNNSFLFKKYYLNEFKIDNVNVKERNITEYNPSELAYVLKNILIPNYQLDKQGVYDTFDDNEIELLYNAILTQQITGKTFVKMNDVEQIEEFMNNAGIDPNDTFGKSRMFESWIQEQFKQENIMYAVPNIYEGEYGYFQVYDMVSTASTYQVQKMVKETLEEEQKRNENNLYFIKNYPNYELKYNNPNIRLRQDVFENGIKSEHCRSSLAHKISTINVSFNPIKFYDLSIYLSRLMLLCGFINDQFQNDVQLIFKQQKGVKFKQGPLKTIERCKLKTETEFYHNETFPTSSCLLDIIRCSVTFDCISTMIENIKYFEMEIKSNKYCLKQILRIKNGFSLYSYSKPDYIDIKFNIKVEINNKIVISEVQFLINELALFKVKGHKYYNIIRQKEFIHNLKRVSLLKNNISKQLRIHGTKGNNKEIMNIIVNKRIKNIDQLQKLNGFYDFLKLLYQNSQIQSLNILLSLCRTYDDFLRFLQIKMQDDTALIIACKYGQLKMVKYLLSLCQNKIKLFAVNIHKTTHGILDMNTCSIISIYCNKNITQQMISDKGRYNYPFDVACTHGHIDVAKYIYSQISIKESKFKWIFSTHEQYNGELLRTAAYNSYPKIMLFLLEKMELLDSKQAAFSNLCEIKDHQGWIALNNFFVNNKELSDVVLIENLNKMLKYGDNKTKTEKIKIIDSIKMGKFTDIFTKWVQQ